MTSLRHQEGYLQIDHRESPGVQPEDLGLQPSRDLPIVGKGLNFETGTIRCSQCHRIGFTHVPHGQRQTDHNYCPKCDSFHCDVCMATNPYGHCLPLLAVFDRLQKEAELLVKGTD